MKKHFPYCDVALQGVTPPLTHTFQLLSNLFCLFCMPLKRIIWVVVRPGLYDGKTGQTCRPHFVSPACSRATIIDCSMRSLSTNPRKSSWYTVRSGSWNVHRGVSRSASLVLPPVLETWERAKDTMVELAWEMPLDSLFSVVKKKKKGQDK